VGDSPHIESEHGHPGIVLATLATANVMALLDMFVVNVALHDIGVSLRYQSSLSDVAWVLNAYALFFGALLIPAGRFADKYGRKATFMAGLAVFTVASAACAISPNLWVLVGFRSVQAIGAAMLIPRA
jgi:MFS family permease